MNWLWHGTNEDAMRKIEKYGFNRSYAGVNAVAHGRGTYFARDVSYSAQTTNSGGSASDGVIKIFACRVAVGASILGYNNQRFPGGVGNSNTIEHWRDSKAALMFDTTIGGTPQDPWCWVTYND